MFSSARLTSSIHAISRRNSLKFGLVAAVGLGVAATGGLVPAHAEGKPKVGLIMKSLSNEFFKQMKVGADKYAEANKDKFDFKVVGMKDERDFASQVDAVENFITQKFDVIVVAPADSKAMATPLAKAVKAGVKVINIDVPLDESAKKAVGLTLLSLARTTERAQNSRAKRWPRILGPAPRW
jgi:ribose transport system substrate-binding protein